ncbi:MAG: NADAR family protein [Cytophagaceae bacterium]
MKYSIQNLLLRIQNGERLKYIYFWGHQPSKGGSITNSCFSQWWHADFTVNGVTYKTAEHWMMARKAELFNDIESYKKIIHSKSPGEAKDIGRMVSGFDQAKWEEYRYGIVVEGNYHKFSQHPKLKEYLINTHDRVLVEASPVDTIWGVGLTKDSHLIENPETWHGLNLLGFALMEVRERLKQE